MAELHEIPLDWDIPHQGSPLEPGSVSLFKFLCERLFDDYEPTEFTSFEKRALDWLNNVSDTNDQMHLLALLLDTFYVGRREFQTLYRATFRNSITNWVIDGHALDPWSNNLQQKIISLANKAWICPISDSLRINSFLKVTGLKSRDKRPDWRSLEQFGNRAAIQSYVKKKKISDLILLEDFVGSGTQAESSVRFASKVLNQTRILLAPLVVCPNGDEKLSSLARQLQNVTYLPTLVLPKTSIHCIQSFRKGEGSDSDAFIVRLGEKLGYKKPEPCFGFKETGAKVVLFSNCPNNTLPLFHKETRNWVPVFPRVTRQ